LLRYLQKIRHMKYFLPFTGLFLFSFLNAQQPNQKKLQKFVEAVNENIEQIYHNRQELSKLNDSDSDEFYDLEIKAFLSPFWNYDFEVLQPLQIAENGDLSMKIKYFPQDDEVFVYTVKGNLDDLDRAVEDIYFILEFDEGTLQETYEYLDSGEIEERDDMLIHFGIDQRNLMNLAKKAGISTDDY